MNTKKKEEKKGFAVFAGNVSHNMCLTGRGAPEVRGAIGEHDHHISSKLVLGLLLPAHTEICGSGCARTTGCLRSRVLGGWDMEFLVLTSC